MVKKAQSGTCIAGMEGRMARLGQQGLASLWQHSRRVAAPNVRRAGGGFLYGAGASYRVTRHVSLGAERRLNAKTHTEQPSAGAICGRVLPQKSLSERSSRTQLMPGILVEHYHARVTAKAGISSGRSP